MHTKDSKTNFLIIQNLIPLLYSISSHQPFCSGMWVLELDWEQDTFGGFFLLRWELIPSALHASLLP